MTAALRQQAPLKGRSHYSASHPFAGYEVTIFEKSNNVGGVWQSNYAGYALQVRRGRSSVVPYVAPCMPLATGRHLHPSTLLCGNKPTCSIAALPHRSVSGKLLGKAGRLAAQAPGRCPCGRHAAGGGWLLNAWQASACASPSPHCQWEGAASVLLPAPHAHPRPRPPAGCPPFLPTSRHFVIPGYPWPDTESHPT